MAAAPPLSDEARAELAAIISRTFGIPNGYWNLNSAVKQAAGFDMYQRIGMENAPMRQIAARLCDEIAAEGKEADCVEALFVALPGSTDLRGFVAGSFPALLALVSEEKARLARAKFEELLLAGRIGVVTTNLALVGAGFTPDAALKKLLRLVVMSLEDLKGYKSIHDILHRLQTGVLAELGRLAGIVDPAERSTSLADRTVELITARADISACCDGFEARGGETLGCRSLLASFDKLLGVLDGADHSAQLTVRRIHMDLRAILRSNMGGFDRNMVEAAKNIPFANVAAALRGPNTAGASAETMGRLRIVADALEDTGRRLAFRRDLHEAWQRLDDILTQLEGNLAGAGNAEELELLWLAITDQLGIIGGMAPQNIAALAARVQPLETAASESFAGLVDPACAPSLRSSFATFTSGVRVQFHAEDRAMLRDCGELVKLRAPLDQLLEG